MKKVKDTGGNEITVPDSTHDLEARIILLEFDVQELKLKLKEKT